MKQDQAGDRPEIEVTPEMVAAGYDVLSGFDAESGDAWDSAIRVYEAMEGARRPLGRGPSASRLELSLAGQALADRRAASARA